MRIGTRELTKAGKNSVYQRFEASIIYSLISALMLQYDDNTMTETERQTGSKRAPSC
jgi:hypothetical protein